MLCRSSKTVGEFCPLSASPSGYTISTWRINCFNNVILHFYFTVGVHGPRKFCPPFLQLFSFHFFIAVESHPGTDWANGRETRIPITALFSGPWLEIFLVFYNRPSELTNTCISARGAGYTCGDCPSDTARGISIALEVTDDLFFPATLALGTAAHPSPQPARLFHYMFTEGVVPTVHS